MLLCGRAALPPAGEAATPRHPRRQPQVPEHRLDAAGRAGAGRPLSNCCAASRPPTTSARANCSARCSPTTPNNVYAGLLTVLLRLVFLLYAEDRGLLSERRGLRQPLLRHRPVRAAARRRRPLPRHDGPALRRLGAAADPVPPRPRRRRARRPRPAGAQGLPLRPRPLPVPRRPAAQALERQPDERDSIRRSSPTAWSTASWTTCSSSTASGSATARSTSSRSARVYETMMGFRLEKAAGRSIAIKPAKAHGAPATINLDELLASRPASAAKWLKEQTDQTLTGAGRDALKAADDARGRCSPPWSRKIAARPRPTSCRRERWSSSPATSAAAPARTTRRARSPSRSSARRSSRCWSSSGRAADAGADPRPEGLRPGDGLGGVSGRGVPAARRRAGRGLARPRSRPAIPPDEDEIAARPPARGPALPLRRGQEPDGRRPRQAVAVAGDAGQGPPLHLPRPRPALRRFAGRPDSQADRRLPLEARQAAGLRAEGDRGAHRRRRRAPAGDPRGGDGTLDALLAQKLARADGASTWCALVGNLVVAAFFAGRQRPKAREEAARVWPRCSSSSRRSRRSRGRPARSA